MFRSQGALYAIEGETVLEVVELPATSPWPGAPEGVIGVVNYRGEILPVIDVALRLGSRPSVAKESDQLVMVRTAAGSAALLVDEALSLNADLELRPMPDEPPLPLRKAAPFLAGLGSVGDQVVLGVDGSKLLHYSSEILAAPDPGEQQAASELLSQRARELAVPVVEANIDEGRGFVMVQLCSERLAIDVKEVAELTDCPPFTPVPGAPPHLLGLAYHRGGLLRLVDVRERCGLDTTGPIPANVVILSGPGMLTGVLVDQIESVVTLQGLGSKLSYRNSWVTVLDTDGLGVREPRFERDQV